MTSNETKMFYIGVTKNYKNRINQHLRAMRGNYHRNRNVQKVYNKGESFNFEVLFESENKEDASAKEIEMIAHYKNLNPFLCCNLNEGGLNTNKGYKQSDYAKAVASKVHSQRTGEKASFYGRKHSKESLEKLSASLSRVKKGVKFSEEHKASLRKYNGRSKRVCIDNVVYYSMMHAEEELGISRKKISKLANDDTINNVYFVS